MVFDDSNLYLIGPDRIYHDGNTPPTGPRGWPVDEKGWVSSQRSGS